MLVYEVYDIRNNQKIGTISGDQLREAAGRTRHSPVFNCQLIKEFNANKERLNEPERLRQVLVS